MAYIKSSYSDSFQKNQTLFLTNLKEFFAVNSSAEKANMNYEKEYEMIISYFNTIPEEFKNEFLLKIANSFFYTSKSLHNVFIDTNVFYFNDFLSNESILPYTKNLQNAVDIKNVFYIAGKLLESSSIHNTKKFIDLFLKKEDKHISNFSEFGTLSNIFGNNLKSSFNYLVSEFTGFSNQEVLLQIITKSDLNENFINDLSNQNIIFGNPLAKALLNKNIPVNRKLSFLNKYYDWKDIPDEVLYFYSYNLDNGNIVDYNLSEDKLFLLFKEKNNLITLCKENLVGYLNYQKFLTKNFISVKEYFEILLTNISDHKINNWDTNDSLKTFFVRNSDLFNTEQYQLLIFKKINSIYLLDFLAVNSKEKNINYDIPLPLNNSTNGETTTLRDLYKSKKTLIINLEEFINETNPVAKNNLFNDIIKQVKEYPENGFPEALTKPHFSKALFDYAIQKEGQQQFIENWFLNISKEDIQNNKMIGLLSKFSDYLKPQINNVAINFSENNPLENLVKNIIKYRTYNNAELLNSILSWFPYQILYTTIEGINLFDYAEKKGLYLPADMKSKYSKETSKWVNKIFSAKKPQHIVFQENNIEIFYNKKEINTVKEIIPQESEIENTNKTFNPFLLNSTFSTAISEANKDLLEYQKNLSSNQMNDMNLEYIIRSENILLDNLNFLNDIKTELDNVNYEHMTFLKNNLSRHLLQSVENYSKSLERFKIISKKGKNSEEQNEILKEKIDLEALKQITLLEKELFLVKEHIINQISQDVLLDMKVGTRIAGKHLKHSTDMLEINEKTGINKP